MKVLLFLPRFWGIITRFLPRTLMPLLTEADTCRRYVLPKLYAAGWSDEQISEQKSFTDGRIVVTLVQNSCDVGLSKRKALL
jgi:hypothetical protein